MPGDKEIAGRQSGSQSVSHLISHLMRLGVHDSVSRTSAEQVGPIGRQIIFSPLSLSLSPWCQPVSSRVRHQARVELNI